MTPILSRHARGLLLLLAGLFTVQPARAAESYDNCAGTISSLPAVINTQGVWCLKGDLATSITSGAAITINTNNVTIDCNDFKVGGLGAGEGSLASGIYVLSRQNATIRHCNIRGFNHGILILGGAGHLVEDNRLDNNLFVGIKVYGDNNTVRRNRVYDTGGFTGQARSYGMDVQANLVDNTVSGLFADVAGGELYALYSGASGAEVSGNTASDFDMTARQGGAVATAIGLYLGNPYQRASGNQVVAIGPVSGYGIDAIDTTDYCLDNTVGGFATNIRSNCISHGNLTAP